MYVIEIRAEDNRIVLGPEEELYRSSFWASNVSFVSGSPPETAIEVSAKVRYKASQRPAVVVPHGGYAEVRFAEPQRAVTPGQAVVFYDGDEIVGGGIIESAPPVPGDGVGPVDAAVGV